MKTQIKLDLEIYEAGYCSLILSCQHAHPRPKDLVDIETFMNQQTKDGQLPGVNIWSLMIGDSLFPTSGCSNIAGSRH